MTWLWQVYALVIAVAFPVAAVIGYLRARRTAQLILLAQIGLFVEVGAVVYAISPGPTPSLTALISLALALVAIDIVFLAWTLIRRRQLLSRPITIGQLDRFNDRAIISRLLTVLALSAFLLNFEPWLGVANLLFFIATTAVWAPARLRQYSLALSNDLPATPRVVFPYLIDPAKWNLYRTGEIKVVKVLPPGPLTTGSRVVSLMPVSIGKSFKPFTLETTTEVTNLLPDEEFSTVWVDRPYERSDTRLEATPSGTRLSFRLDAVMPFWLAAMGAVFDVRAVIAKRRAEMEQNYARLQDILAAGPAQ